MLGTASNLWGRATDVLASTAKNAADHLDSIGAAIKETLNEDTADSPEHEYEVEELEEYKKMLSEMEMQHVELSKQCQLTLAGKDAEISMYRSKLRELLPDEAAYEEAVQVCPLPSPSQKDIIDDRGGNYVSFSILTLSYHLIDSEGRQSGDGDDESREGGARGDNQRPAKEIMGTAQY